MTRTNIIAGIVAFGLFLAVLPASVPAAEAPDVVVQIDEFAYSRDDVRLYAELLVGEEFTDANAQNLADQIVLDHVAYDDAVAEFPGIPRTPEVVTGTRRFLGRTLVPRMLDGVREGVNPTVDDVVRILPETKTRYDLAMIVSEDREKILAAERELAAGEPFGEVAKRHSDGFSADKGGTIKPVFEGEHANFTPEEFGQFAALEEGAVSRPFPTRIGWALVKLLHRASPEEQKREEATRNLATYREKMRGEAVQKFVASLRESARVDVRDNVVSSVRASLDAKAPVPAELRGEPIALVDGVPIYVFEVEQLRGQHSVEILERFIDRRVGEEILILEAVKRSDKELTARYERLAGRRLATREYFKRKRAAFFPTAGELKAFYDANPGLYATRETRRLRLIQNPKRAKVEEGIRRARKGEDFAKLAARLNGTKEQREAKGDVGFVRREALRKDIGDKVFDAAKGGVLGPFESVGPDGKPAYLAIRVEEIAAPQPLPYERVEKSLLADRYVSRKMEEFHKEFRTKASEGHKIRVFLENPVKGAGGDGAIAVGGNSLGT